MTQPILIERRAQAADIHQQLKILSNTIASGEANETACYEAQGWLLRRLSEINDEITELERKP